MLNEDEANERYLEFKKFFENAMIYEYFKLAFIIIIILGIFLIHKPYIF